MSAEYDKERTAALIKEAHDITSHLKIETEVLERQMARLFNGDDEETSDPPASQKVVTAPSRWRFWR